mmetsp:Transcript_30071/g.73057  ORF Transcript_30071/g.73057 Transcript_30071/m.73057 type:complete len:231 (-) Transcript_30071:1146-1838(-)
MTITTAVAQGLILVTCSQIPNHLAPSSMICQDLLLSSAPRRVVRRRQGRCERQRRKQRTILEEAEKKEVVVPMTITTAVAQGLILVTCSQIPNHLAPSSMICQDLLLSSAPRRVVRRRLLHRTTRRRGHSSSLVHSIRPSSVGRNSVWTRLLCIIWSSHPFYSRRYRSRRYVPVAMLHMLLRSTPRTTRMVGAGTKAYSWGRTRTIMVPTRHRRPSPHLRSLQMTSSPLH